MEIKVPVLNWFESNPWAKIGNKYTGSVGAVSLHNNAFLYRINFFRTEDGPQLEAEAYDSLLEADKDETKYQKKSFAGTLEGRDEMIKWLGEQYDEYVSSGRAKKIIKY